MNSAEDKRAALREKLAKLSDAELAKRLYLIGLVARIDAELLAMVTLFGSGDEPLQLSPPPDGRITSIQHLLMVEIKRRNAAVSQQEKGGHDSHGKT